MSEYSLIPVLTSEAGSCLTLDNWRSTGANTGVYSLEALLIKPGLVVLQDFSDLRAYTGWPGTLILNACLSTVSATGEYVVRSPYDGSVTKITPKALFALISHLQVDYVIWPHSILDESMVSNSMPQFLMPGVNYFADRAPLFYGIDDGSFDKAKLASSTDSKMSIWIESDRPALDALQAKMYSRAGVFNLLELAYQEDFLLLDAQCACFTCREGFTRAYLHHLIQHTPLLAQRFLILHNYTFASRQKMNFEQNQSFT